MGETSEELPPGAVLVLYDDGRTTVAGNTDDAAVAQHLRKLADVIEAGHHREGCTACASNVPHDHNRQE